MISSTEDGATIDDIANFLLEAVQIPLSCSSTPSQNGTPQMIDACTQDCFKKVINPFWSHDPLFGHMTLHVYSFVT